MAGWKSGEVRTIAGVRRVHVTQRSTRGARRLTGFLLLLACWCSLRAGRMEAQTAADLEQMQNVPAGVLQTAPRVPVQTATPSATRTGNVTNNSSQDSVTQRSGRAEEARQRQDAADPSTALPERQTEFQTLVEVSTGQQLPIFGASLFARVPSTFAPVDDVPVTPDYVIGPGDQIRLQVWGQVNQQGSYVVDRTGSIAIPQVGTIHVAGLSFAELTGFLRAQLGRVYRNFDLNVNLGQLRSIQVFVVGQARRPGSYTIGSLSTLLNALFASGGPRSEGSLRDIQVRRGNEVVTHFDMYDLLLRGDKSKDVMLQPGDVIFIPSVGPQVALAGSVKNPAIYELRGETGIEQLLELGGGRTSVAAGTAVRLERIFEHTSRTIADVDLAKSPATPLQNGDVVSVMSIVDRFKDAVTLRGNVANPGRYVWHQGMRVSELIPDKESLVTRNYWRKRNELGQMPMAYAPAAQPDQQGRSYPQADGANGRRDVGSTEATRAGQTGNGNNNNGSNNNGSPNGGNSSGASDSGLSNSNRPQDTLQRGATSESGGGSVGVALTGSNGVFAAQNDVVLSAPDIDWSYAVVERLSGVDLTTSLLPFNLGKIVLEGDRTQDLELLPGDVVTIFSTADLRVATSQQTRFVRLEGEFHSAGIYSVRPGETLRQLLVRAGGFTPDAYLYASEFTRQSTRRVERQRLNEYADQLEAQVSAVSSGTASGLLGVDAAAAAVTAEQARGAIARLRSRDPIGRIVLNLRPDSRGVEGIPDLALEDGDRFVVPRVPSNVTVEGQVYSANALVYRPHRRVKDYLKEAGGPDRQADRSRAFVLRADGSVLSRQYGSFEKAQLYPGDTIVVPPVLNRRSVLRTIVDVASIVGQLGFAVAAINVLR